MIVLVVSYNTCQLTLQCLASVFATVGELPVQVMLVDNASHDDTVAAVREQFPAVTVIANKDNAGLAAANNQGLRLARGRYACLTNSDTVLQPGALTKLCEFPDAHAGVALFVHCVNYIGVTNSEQITIVWYLTPAIVGRLTPRRALARASPNNHIASIRSQRRLDNRAAVVAARGHAAR